MRTTAVLGIGLWILVGQSVRGEKKERLPEIGGRWGVEAVVIDGNKVKAEDFGYKGAYFVIGSDKIHVYTPSLGTGEDRYSFKLRGPDKTGLKTLDLVAETGAVQGQTVEGIYELRDGTLTMGWMRTPPGGPRPRSFTCKGCCAFVLKPLKR